MKKNRVIATVLSITMMITAFGLSTNVYAAKSESGIKPYKIHLKHGKLESGNKKVKTSEATVENGSKTKPYIVVFNNSVTDEMKRNVEKAGVKLVEYLPDDSYLCLMSPKIVDSLYKIEYIADVIQYNTEFKIDPALSSKITDENKDTEVEISISTFEEAKKLKDEIIEKSGSIISRRDNLLIANVKYKYIEKISKYDAVKFIQENVKEELHNDVATAIIGAETASSIGYEGEGEIVCVADTGLDTGKPGLANNSIHEDFSGRVIDIIPENANNPYGRDENGHGTHVAGSVLGSGTMSDGQIKGTAPKAQLIMQAVGDKGGSIDIEGTLYDLLDRAYDKGARIHTNSWGEAVKGAYTENCEDVDKFIWNNQDMTVLFSAGNSGKYGNSTLGSPGTAKNCITVGATINYRPYKSVSNDPDERADFSSYGTSDGRIKPDVVAPGKNIASSLSSLAGAEYPYPLSSYYQYMSGTSMSTPITAGAVAVIREYIKKNYNISSPSAALVKAFLINGVLDKGYTQDKGWGKVSLTDSLMATRILDEASSVTVGETKVYSNNCEVKESDEPLKISLVWTDYPGSSVASKALVNDLDLKVTSPSGSVSYYGNDFSSPCNTEVDRINNVENVIIQNPEIGIYRIEVEGYRVPNGPQPYVIVYSSDFLSTPKNVKGSALKDSITVNWDAVPGATGYDIEVDGIDVKSLIDTSYTHNNLDYNKEHKYRIRAKNQDKIGSWSNTVIRATAIDSPQVATKAVNDGVQISWNSVDEAPYCDVYIDGDYLDSTDKNEYLFASQEKDAVYNVSVRAKSYFNASNPSEGIQVRNLDGGIYYKAPMYDARMDFGAVAASNGKIYVIGGKEGPSYLDAVEEYDPSADTWNNQKSPMISKRINFAAVEANNGKIYVIGGENSTSALNTVEEYDPESDKWVTKASMNVERSGLGAVTLNGKIYAIGGKNTENLNSVEVYDPVNDNWTILQSPMHQKRSDFGISTVNGKIVVIGGRCGSDIIDSVEEFDPITNKWTFKQNMNKPNSDFSMAQIDGKLYCSGGENSDIIEEYDPVLNKWTDRRKLPEGVKGHESVSKDGKLYILGGYTGSSYINTVVEYNPIEGLWERKSSMNINKAHFTATEADGKIYTFGGLGGGSLQYGSLDAVEEYDIINDKWSYGEKMKNPSVFADSITVNGRIYVCGGSSDIFYSKVFDTMQEYDYANKKWIDRQSMPEARAQHELISLNGYIYVIGGKNGDGFCSDKVLRYDIDNDSWSTMKSSFPVPRANHAIATANGKIYVIGGSTWTFLNIVHEYDPLTDTWTEKNPLTQNFVQAGSVSLNDKIYLFFASEIFEYDPSKESLVEIQKFPFDMHRNKIVLCENKIFALGGIISIGLYVDALAMDGVYCSDELLPGIFLGNEVMDVKSGEKAIPVTVTNIPSGGICKAEIAFEFDPQKLGVIDVTSGSAIPEGFDVTYNVDNTNGIVSIQYTGDRAIVNNGNFANVQFDVLDDVNEVGETKITLIRDSCKLFTDQSKELETKKLTDGSIDIFMFGDLNGDSNINAGDKLLIDRYCLDIYNTLPGDYGILAADVSGDGKINAGDGILIKRYLLELITEFPVQQ